MLLNSLCLFPLREVTFNHILTQLSVVCSWLLRKTYTFFKTSRWPQTKWCTKRGVIFKSSSLLWYDPFCCKLDLKTFPEWLKFFNGLSEASKVFEAYIRNKKISPCETRKLCLFLLTILLEVTKAFGKMWWL